MAATRFPLSPIFMDAGLPLAKGSSVGGQLLALLGTHIARITIVAWKKITIVAWKKGHQLEVNYLLYWVHVTHVLLLLRGKGSSIGGRLFVLLGTHIARITIVAWERVIDRKSIIFCTGCMWHTYCCCCVGKGFQLEVISFCTGCMYRTYHNCCVKKSYRLEVNYYLYWVHVSHVTLCSRLRTARQQSSLQSSLW